MVSAVFTLPFPISNVVLNQLDFASSWVMKFGDEGGIGRREGVKRRESQGVRNLREIHVCVGGREVLK